MPDTQPVVSICCITYNHEKYIRDAIEGFLMQETDFPIEIIIHDDASTDSTPDIIREYVDKYPNLFVPIFQTENQYSQGKRIYGTFVLPRARGKYIALCEGDDYWISPHKLQRQVEYMEAHPECQVCFHTAQVVYEDELKESSTVVAPPKGLAISFDSWFQHRAKYKTFIATASVVFRHPRMPIPHWYYNLRAAGDWPLITWLLLSGGDLGFIDATKLMSAYRKHRGGVTTQTWIMRDSPKRVQRLLDDLHDHTVVGKQLTARSRRYLRPRIHRLHLALAREYSLSGDTQKSRSHVLKAVYYLSPSRLEIKSMLLIAIQCYLPKLYPKLLALNSYLRHARA